MAEAVSLGKSGSDGESRRSFPSDQLGLKRRVTAKGKLKNNKKTLCSAVTKGGSSCDGIYSSDTNDK